GRELIDLCGVPVGSDAGGASAVLKRFIGPFDPTSTQVHLNAQNCHIQESADCRGQETTALASLNPTCLRGQVGEAWLAVESARQRVVRAKDTWIAARATEDGWNRHCQQKQDAINETEKIIDQIRDLQIAEIKEQATLGLIGGALDVLAGGATGFGL